MTKKSSAKTVAESLAAKGIDATRASLTMLPPEALTLITEKDHPLYDPRVELPVDKDSPLYIDIKTKNVEKPIEVRKNGEGKDGMPILQVIDGRQRVQILISVNIERTKAGLPPYKLPVNFVRGDDKSMVLRSLSSNLLRREETPFSKAVKMQKAQQLGAAPEEIAQACNIETVALVDRYMAILNFIPSVQKAFNGDLPASAIDVFAKVPREEQAEVLKTVQAGGAKTTKQVKAAVEATREGKEYKAKDTAKMLRRPRVEEIQTKIKKLLRSKKGQDLKVGERTRLETAVEVLDVVLAETAIEAVDVLNFICEAPDEEKAA